MDLVRLGPPNRPPNWGQLATIVGGRVVGDVAHTAGSYAYERARELAKEAIIKGAKYGKRKFDEWRNAPPAAPASKRSNAAFKLHPVKPMAYRTRSRRYRRKRGYGRRRRRYTGYRRRSRRTSRVARIRRSQRRVWNPTRGWYRRPQRQRFGAFQVFQFGYMSHGMSVGDGATTSTFETITLNPNDPTKPVADANDQEMQGWTTYSAYFKKYRVKWVKYKIRFRPTPAMAAALNNNMTANEYLFFAVQPWYGSEDGTYSSTGVPVVTNYTTFENWYNAMRFKPGTMIRLVKTENTSVPTQWNLRSSVPRQVKWSKKIDLRRFFRLTWPEWNDAKWWTSTGASPVNHVNHDINLVHGYIHATATPANYVCPVNIQIKMGVEFKEPVFNLTTWQSDMPVHATRDDTPDAPPGAANPEEGTYAELNT